MKSAEYVVINRGRFEGKDALELLFEDHSDNPLSIVMQAEMTDRMLPDDYQGGGFDVTVWTKDGQQAAFKGKYRVVARLPFPFAWQETH